MTYMGNDVVLGLSVTIAKHGGGWKIEMFVEARRTGSRRERVTFNLCSFVDEDIAIRVGRAAQVWLAYNMPPGKLSSDQLRDLRKDFKAYWHWLPRDAAALTHPNYTQWTFEQEGSLIVAQAIPLA